MAAKLADLIAWEAVGESDADRDRTPRAGDACHHRAARSDEFARCRGQSRTGEVWSEFSATSDAHVAVLTGKGEKAFSAGADLKSLIPAQRSAVTGGESRT